MPKALNYRKSRAAPGKVLKNAMLYHCDTVKNLLLIPFSIPGLPKVRYTNQYVIREASNTGKLAFQH